MVKKAAHESVLNARLAELLRSFGLAATAEHRQLGSKKQIDVDVDLGSHRVALEAEIDNQRGAVVDAKKRLTEAEEGLVVAETVIAVSYPAALQASTFTSDTDIAWCVLPSNHFSIGTVWDLAGVLRRVHPSNSDPEEIAKRLDDTLTLTVYSLSAQQQRDLARELEVERYPTAKAAERFGTTTLKSFKLCAQTRMSISTLRSLRD